MGFLDGKGAVVTGAGSEMGNATAMLLAREGALIVGCDISAAEEQTADGLGGDAIVTTAVSLTKPGSAP